MAETLPYALEPEPVMRRAFFAFAALVLALSACDLTGPDEDLVVLYVGPERVECMGFTQQTCYLVRDRPEDDWEYFYDPIEGFDFEPGFLYTLLVRKEEVENPPADGSRYRWTLEEILEKKRAPDGGAAPGT